MATPLSTLVSVELFQFFNLFGGEDFATMIVCANGAFVDREVSTGPVVFQVIDVPRPYTR